MTSLSTQVVVAALCGAIAGLGLVLLAAAIRGVPARPHPGGSVSWRVRLAGRERWLVATVLAAIGTVALTGWIAAGILAAAASWWGPDLVGPDRQHTVEVARLEAIATWTEALRDTLGAAAGLQQALLATATAPPAPIAAPVRALAARLHAETRLTPALRELAVELADPTADLVVVALINAAQYQARALGELLGELARATRAQVSLRLRANASRARIRTATRVVVITTLAMALGLIVLNRGYLAPYHSATGQLILLIIGALFATGFAWLRRLGTPPPSPRLLAATTPDQEA